MLFSAHRYLIVIAALFGSRAYSAQPLTSLVNGHIRWNDCAAGIDEPEQAYPAVCLQLRGAGQIALKQPGRTDNLALTFVTGYLGLHPQSWIGLHLAGDNLRVAPFGGSSVALLRNDQTVRSAYLQLGNPAHHPWRLAFGQLDMPYGIDFNPLMELYGEHIKTQRFWRFPRFVTRATIDNMVSTQLDLGYGSERILGTPTSKEDQAIVEHGLVNPGADPFGNEALSLRLHHDFSALEGSRLSAFWYADKTGERRFGAAFTNLDAKGHHTVLEWQRMRSSIYGSDLSMQQLFRLSFAGAFRRETRWLFEYEDDRKRYRLTTLGYDFKMPDYGLFRLAASYYIRGRKEDRSYWFLTSGVQVSI